MRTLPERRRGCLDRQPKQVKRLRRCPARRAQVGGQVQAGELRFVKLRLIPCPQEAGVSLSGAPALCCVVKQLLRLGEALLNLGPPVRQSRLGTRSEERRVGNGWRP